MIRRNFLGFLGFLLTNNLSALAQETPEKSKFYEAFKYQIEDKIKRKKSSFLLYFWEVTSGSMLKTRGMIDPSQLGRGDSMLKIRTVSIDSSLSQLDQLEEMWEIKANGTTKFCPIFVRKDN